jgi:hypothetical protein
MKHLTAIAFVISIVLCSCNQNSNKEEQTATGGIDSAAIARDTATQKSIDNSYEFATTLAFGPNLVYDIRAFGGPASRGNFAIIRRAGNNKPDTVVQGIRYGAVINAFTADLDTNKESEIYIVTRRAGNDAFADIIAYKFDKNGGATSLILPPVSAAEKPQGYMGHDSIYAERKYLVRQYPVYKKDDDACCPSGGTGKLYYGLQNNIFVKKAPSDLPQ